MAVTSRKKKTKAAQQWAWEFLRRNPDYRDAFRKLTALPPEQLTQIGILAAGEEEHQPDEYSGDRDRSFRSIVTGCAACKSCAAQIVLRELRTAPKRPGFLAVWEVQREFKKSGGGATGRSPQGRGRTLHRASERVSNCVQKQVVF